MCGVKIILSASLLFVVCLLLGAQPAAALIDNGSFETGDTSGWSTVGDVSVTDSSFGIDPANGTYQILLGTSGATLSETETAMGLAPGTIQSIFDANVSSSGSGPTEGSAFQQTFDINEPGESVTLFYNMVTNESVPEATTTDFLWYYLDKPSANDVSGVLADANQDIFSASGSSYDSDTGYQSIRLQVNQVGTYTLTIGIHDVEDIYTDSGAVFDNFYLRKSPEPDTALLLAAGLLGLAFHARRAKETRAGS